MAKPYTGHLIWYRHQGTIQLGLYARNGTKKALGAARKPVCTSSHRLHWLDAVPSNTLVYRHPIQLLDRGNRIEAGPIFAVLAGGNGVEFNGCRTDFRELMHAARLRAELLYVIPAGHVDMENVWSGCVRKGYKHWIELPCPLPGAIYNRVPTRNIERSEPVVHAKSIIGELEIPIFNFGYFNKAMIYDAIISARLERYLPDSSTQFQEPILNTMLDEHEMVYLKPNGGSIGHGIMRVRRQGRQFTLEVLKNGTCKLYEIPNRRLIWAAIERHRLPGSYVLQAGKTLIQWNGRPCDFRVLIQKYQERWRVVGKGVRVAGPETITTHVPNGGYIMDSETVLAANFGDMMDKVSRELEQMTISCAEAIDRRYGAQLGEMSMDVGVDARGAVWFFEANAKPMKFDEPDIRQGSLEGILNHLGELSQWGSVIRDES